MANIPIRDITLTGTPTASSNIVFDDGQMKKGVASDFADAIRPVASQAEAEAGSDNAKTMTALRTKQSIASEVGVSIASKSQGDLAASALQSDDIGSSVQAHDADLDAIAALTPTNDDILQRKSGAWTNRTPAQVKTDLALATVATSGAYSDLSGKPTLGTAAATDTTAYATAAQGTKADSAVQPGDLGALATEDTVTSALLNADVFSTAHTWSGTQTFSSPVVGTQASGDNSTKAASTAFVQDAVSEAGGGDVLGASSSTDGGIVVFDGTNGKKIKPLDDADAALTELGATTVGAEVFKASDAAAARTAIGAALSGHIVGITLANNTSDATNDIDFGDGECASDSVSPILMKHSAGTAQLDVAYGTGTGGRFDSSIADGTWHCFVISDGTTVSRGFSQSLDPTGAPNYPSGYAYRRVGSILRATSILAFVQIGRKFLRKVPFQKINTSNPGTSAVTANAGCPSGVSFRALLSIQLTSATASTSYAGLVTALAQTDTTPSTTLNNLVLRTQASGTSQSMANIEVPTDTSSQFRYRLSVSDASLTISIIVNGWIDDLTPS